MRLSCNKITYFFGRSFIPISVLVIFTVAIVYYFDNKSRSIELYKDEYNRISMQEEIIKHEMDHIISDLMVLSHHDAFKQYRLDKQLNLSSVQNQFLHFLMGKQKYDKIRFIRSDGMEMVRVNRSHPNPLIIPGGKLQNKSGRYYFRDSMKLSKGDIFVSPLDLNIENGQIEEPIKPMLRFATPVFNDDDEKIGIIIINFLANHIFEQLDHVGAESKSSVLMLNRDGYYLKGLSKQDEWGFMYSDRTEVSFRNDFPSAWERIIATGYGQYIDDNALFTFVTISPLPQTVHSSSGSMNANGYNENQLYSDEYYWFLVSYAPSSLRNNQIQKIYLYSTVILLLVVGFCAWKSSKAQCQRLLAERELEREATHDALTQLPNRKLLYQQLDHVILLSQRSHRKFALLFVDLDKFKAVNDSFGHKAGDIVLVTAAHRIKSILRKSDTVARIGGDEFVILLPELEHEATPNMLAEKVKTVITKPVLIKSGSSIVEQCVGASIGISVYPDDGVNSDDLIHSADKAMYRVKKGR